MALYSTVSDKAPGPDGINNGILKKTWKWTKDSCLEFVKEFFSLGTIPKGMNSSFITLVPKKQDPIMMSDFRPISLINCSFKILSKVLSNRLKGVMHKIVSKSQSGFIKGRQISETILIANAIEHAMGKGKIKGIILKLDFKKAFDSVDWEFLLNTMIYMGFGVR